MELLFSWGTSLIADVPGSSHGFLWLPFGGNLLKTGCPLLLQLGCRNRGNAQTQKLPFEITGLFCGQALNGFAGCHSLMPGRL
jgi:hypothetical protein